MPASGRLNLRRFPGLFDLVGRQSETVANRAMDRNILLKYEQLIFDWHDALVPKVQQFVAFLGHLQQDIFIHMEINKRPERIKSDLYRLKEYAAIDSQNGRNGSIGLTLASNIVDRKQHVISIYHFF